MKKTIRYGAWVSLFLTLVFAIGCHKSVHVPVPGELNAFDAYTFRALFDLQAALNSFKADIESGKTVAGPGLKGALNQAITDYDVAEATYKAWHVAGGTGPEKDVSDSLSKAQTDLANLASQASGK